MVALWLLMLPTFVVYSDSAPHIIFNVVDDLGWNDLGYQRGALPGQDNAIESPHIDALALSGVRLHDYAVFKFCSPSRSQFLTGRYAYHLGQQTKINLPCTVHAEHGTCGLPLGYSMIPAVLKRYASEYISRAYGKWHQGFFNESYTPVARGFDSFFGFYDGGQSYYTHITPYGVWRDPTTPLFWTPSNFGGPGKGGNVTYPLMHTKDRCGALVDLANDTLDATTGRIILRHADASLNGTHSTELLAKQVVDDIAGHDTSRPLFVYLAWHAVHDPLEVDPEYTALYEGKIEDTSRRVLAGMISNLDQGVANVTGALKQKGMWENTVWIMTTDNGGPVCLNMSASTQRGEQSIRDCGTNNWPLRGSKMTLWEGGVRGIGFIASGNPDFIPRRMHGQVWDGMMHGTDWYVTLLSLAGVATSKIMTTTGPLPPDGLDILAALRANGTSPRTELVHNIDESSKNAMRVGSIRVGDWKLIKGYPGCTTNGSDTPSNPSGTKGGCYNGVDFAWKPPEMTQPGFDVGIAFSYPPPCSATPCLFNVKVDPAEQYDRSISEPSKVAELLKRYHELRASEVSMEDARLCLTDKFPDGCVANLGTGVWAPWVPN